MVGFFKKLFGASEGKAEAPESPSAGDGQAYTFRLPDEVADWTAAGNTLNGDEFEEGHRLVWQGRYFVRAIAVMPLTDLSSDLEWGLWVELNQQDFQEYQRALTDVAEYDRFTAHGVLCNDWPPFTNTRGDDVRIQVLDVNAKPFIVEVFTDHNELSALTKQPALSDNDKQIVRMKVKKFWEEPLARMRQGG